MMTLQERIKQIEEEKNQHREALLKEDVLPPELIEPNSCCRIQSGIHKKYITAALEDRRSIG